MDVIRHCACIPAEAAGQRLDRALAGMFPEYSRSRLTQWIKAGSVQVDGAGAIPRQRVHGGEEVAIHAELAPALDLRPQAMALDIVHEDADVIVLVKPAGLVVHPGAGNPDGTLLNALLHHDPELAQLPRAGIVHRLDKDTSGLMVVARSLPAHTALVDMLSRHEVARQYEAVVQGELIAGGSVDAPLGRHPRERIRQAVREAGGGRHALTHYRVRERFRGHTRVECRLETGRTHQIRVHMAHAGHPLVGDPLYGGRMKLPRAPAAGLAEALQGFRRQALHAERLAFVHPRSGDQVTFEAPRPADMQLLIDALRKDAVDRRAP